MAVELHVEITYLPHAVDFSTRAALAATGPEGHNLALERLRRELTALKLPHPRPANLEFVEGGVRFYWIAKEGSRLQTSLEYRSQVHKRNHSPAMKEFSIKNIDFSVNAERIDVHPYFNRPFRSFQPEIHSSAPSNTPAVDSRSSAFHGFFSDRPPASSSAQPFSVAPMLQPSSNRKESFSTPAPILPEEDHAPADATSTDALDEAYIFKFLKELKGEEPAQNHGSLSRRSSSIASSVPSVHPDPEVPVKQEPVSHDVVGVRTAARASLSSSLEGIVWETQVPSVEMLGATPPGNANDESEDMEMSESPIPGLGGAIWANRTLAPTIGDSLPPIRNLPEDEKETVENLSNQLQDVHQHIEASLLKEQAIVQALRDLNTDIPEPYELSVSENIFLQKARVQSLKREEEIARLKRHAVEDTIKAIAAERRPPFVSAALLDAFVGISRLSTRVLDGVE